MSGPHPDKGSPVSVVAPQQVSGELFSVLRGGAGTGGAGGGVVTVRHYWGGGGSDRVRVSNYYDKIYNKHNK